MRKDFKENLLNILNGVSSGVVITLVPGALINELMKGMSSFWPGAQDILTMTTLMQNLLAVFAGLCVSYLLKFNLIQSGSVAAAAMSDSGAFEMKNGHIMLNGSGDVINIGLTIFIAAKLVKYLTPKLGSYTVLFLTLSVAVFAGGLSQFALPYTKMITGMIGSVVSVLTDFQPLVKGTPKIQMANILRNPKLFVPVVVSAGLPAWLVRSSTSQVRLTLLV
ncbi:PTS sugar transporter subunit IIC [Lactobacillus kitasatonis]|uniref:PTS sugar transporter subunit IIC n=1 Tax=Lactobacillus kitasatonis TaxID=237446 RepID=UPI001F5C85FF|nr:PTS sugar transporter subunit IIC [Lactobacillus kitasatonis]